METEHGSGAAAAGKSETTATAKRECPACGGEAEWSPSQKSLVCRYCGMGVPADLAGGEITAVAAGDAAQSPLFHRLHQLADRRFRLEQALQRALCLLRHDNPYIAESKNRSTMFPPRGRGLS